MVDMDAYAGDGEQDFTQQMELNELIADAFDGAAEDTHPAPEPGADDSSEGIDVPAAHPGQASDGFGQAALPPQEDPNGRERASPTALAPPAHFNSAEKKLFAGLDEVSKRLVRDVVRRTDQEVSRYRTDLDRRSAQYQELDQIFAARQQQFALEGVTGTQAVSQLLAISDFAAADPAGFVQWFASQRQVDLASLAASGAGQNARPQSDPNLAALQNQVSLLSQQLEQQSSASYEQQRGAVQTEIDDFRSASDPEGTPLFPYFDTLETDMAALIRAGTASTLEDAYEQAAWANPVVRNALLADRDEAERSRRAAQDRTKAQRARRAAKSLDGGVGGLQATAPISLRDSLEEKFNAY